MSSSVSGFDLCHKYILYLYLYLYSAEPHRQTHLKWPPRPPTAHDVRTTPQVAGTPGTVQLLHHACFCASSYLLGTCEPGAAPHIQYSTRLALRQKGAHQPASRHRLRQQRPLPCEVRIAFVAAQQQSDSFLNRDFHKFGT